MGNSTTLSKVVQDAINQQINNEFFSGYSYLAMAAYCERKQFSGCASWLRVQSQEEMAHAMRLYDFMVARDGEVHMLAIKEPPADYESLPHVFETALAQEQEVTKQIDALYELALKEKAFAALVEMEWFITEQVEEEKVARQIVHKFGMVKNDPAALLDLDRDLGNRTTADSPA